MIAFSILFVRPMVNAYLSASSDQLRAANGTLTNQSFDSLTLRTIYNSILHLLEMFEIQSMIIDISLLIIVERISQIKQPFAFNTFLNTLGALCHFISISLN